MKKLLVIALTIMVIGCAAQGDTPAQQRAEIQKMSQQVLSDIYRESPGAQKKVNAAAGYGVFTNAQINLIFMAAGGGYGVVHNNQTGAKTYMNMGEAGLGLGLGAKDFRVLFVFHTPKALDDFVEKGWAFGAEADAAAKSGDKGGQMSGGITIGDITVYQLTENGLALQATVKGTKYWKNDDLN